MYMTERLHTLCTYLYPQPTVVSGTRLSILPNLYWLSIKKQ